ncbi:MAG TPA: LysE family transporter [Terriglobales bacterium]|nr:LysE family transporter [Terriglobales bacterium]
MMTLQAWIPIFSIAAAISMGAVSPGPSFVMVLRIAIADSRRAGLAAALGMGIGGMTFGALAVFGLQALIAQVGWLYLALKVAGGLYLIYLASRIWRGAAEPMQLGDTVNGATQGVTKAFWRGLATQLSNPKTAVVYGSIFAALLPAHPAPWTFAVLLPMLFAIEAGWYTIVAYTFSSSRPRAVYLRAKGLIDRAAGAIIGLLGIKLVYNAVSGR